jgi:hypothetical protein
MRNVAFGAEIIVGNLSPHHPTIQEKIRSKSNSLRTYYANYGDDVVGIGLLSSPVLQPDIMGKQRWYPSVQALIQAGNLQTELHRNVGDVFDEPIWKFFGRIRHETNKLIKAAGLKPRK